MTASSGLYSWTPLHDLALIYLALTHGADAEIDPVEMETMSEKLQEWQPEMAAEHTHHVIEEVMLMYVSGASQNMLTTSVASLRQSLPRDQRVAVLNDLADLASADGMVVPGEVSFIQQLARQWEVERGDLS